MRIPTDITPLEYIAGSGSQYIETAIHLLSTDVVKSKWRFQNSAGNVYGCFTSSGANDNFCLYAGSASTNAYIRYDGQVVRDFKAVSGTVYEIEHGPDGFFANGSKEADFDAASFTCSAPMYIFMLPNSSSAKVTARCYGLQVIRGGVVAYDFIPARNEATGEVGMWEAVNGVWYGNDGTGAFTAGSVADRVLGTTHDGWRRRLLAACAKHYEIVPGSDGYTWCYYDVNDTENATKILNNNSGVNNTMIVDGVSVSLSYTYLFTTTGLHLVKFKFNTYSTAVQYFAYCSRLVACYLDASITTLPYRMFRDSTNLEKVGVDYVTAIAANGEPFMNCSSLLNVSFKSFVSASAGTRAFSGCTSLQTVEYPVVEQITGGDYALSTCRKVIIGPNCTQLAGRVCQSNTTLNTFICKAISPPSLGRFFLYGTSALQSIYVPDESVNNYKAADIWSNFASKIKPLSDYTE